MISARMWLTMDYFLIFFLSFVIVLIVSIASFLIFRHIKCCCRRRSKKQEEIPTYMPNPMFYGNINLANLRKHQCQNKGPGPAPPGGSGYYTAPAISPGAMCTDHFQVTGEPYFFVNNIQPNPSAEWMWGYLYGLQAAGTEGVESGHQQCYNPECTVYTISSATTQNTWAPTQAQPGSSQTNFDYMVATNSAKAATDMVQQAADGQDAEASGSGDADGHDAAAADCAF